MKITLDDLNPLTEAYSKAVEKEKKEFKYKGTLLLTGYAKYLIEHLNNILKQNS